MAKQSEPVLRDPQRAFRSVFDFHGPRRYACGADAFNGACTLIEPSIAFEQAATRMNCDLYGEGAAWAWFVGSPRAFLFGFTRSKSWAARKMNAHLRSEFEAVTGRKIA